MTTALRPALGVAVRGSVWLGVWLCVGCVWIYRVATCEPMRGLCAYIKTKPKKQTLSHTRKNKKEFTHMCKGYTIPLYIQGKKPFNCYTFEFLRWSGRCVWGKLHSLIYDIPLHIFLLNISHTFYHTHSPLWCLFSPPTV